MQAPFGALGPRQRRRLGSQRVAGGPREAQLGHLLEAVVRWRVGRLVRCHPSCAAAFGGVLLPDAALGQARSLGLRRARRLSEVGWWYLVVELPRQRPRWSLLGL